MALPAVGSAIRRAWRAYFVDSQAIGVIHAGRGGQGNVPAPQRQSRNLPGRSTRPAGWSVGEIGTATAWIVMGANGENALDGRDRTQAEATWRTCEQARAVGVSDGSDKPQERTKRQQESDRNRLTPSLTIPGE
jgi:hypothetical protein